MCLAKVLSICSIHEQWFEFAEVYLAKIASTVLYT